MTKKGMELAISTLILMVLGVVLLIGLIFLVGRSLGWFGTSTEPFTHTNAIVAVREGCNVACQSQDRLTYCCKKFDVNGEDMLCSDSRLEVTCSLQCADFSCTPQQ